MDVHEKARQACITLTKKLLNNKNGNPFSQPVDYVALGIPHYPDIIKNPMDLGTIQKKLSSNDYSNVDEWIADVRLVFTNATVFNPADHPVHLMAKTLNQTFEKNLAMMLEKLDTRSFVNDGRGATLGTAASNEWPRKAKSILKSIMDHPQAFPFNEQVDWKKLKIPDYPKIIKKPMDLSKVERQLNQHHYNTVEDFAGDVRLVFTNAKTYNVEFSDIHQMAKKVESHFEELFASSFKSKKRAAPDAKAGSSKKLKKDDSDDDLSDVSHELPEEPTDEEKQRPVTVEEKRTLNEKISVLKSDDLGKMVDIIKDRCPKSIDQTKDDEIEIDVDALEPGDFWYISKFVNMCAIPFAS
jgi:hypothetical protein